MAGFCTPHSFVEMWGRLQPPLPRAFATSTATATLFEWVDGGWDAAALRMDGTVQYTFTCVYLELKLAWI